MSILRQLRNRITCRVAFWFFLLYSVFFALAELAVRNFGYPTDNTFIYLALFCLLFSGPFLYEMLTGRSFFTVIAGQKHGDGN